MKIFKKMWGWGRSVYRAYRKMDPEDREKLEDAIEEGIKKAIEQFRK